MIISVGTLDVHMHLVFPALIRLFRVEASVDIRRHAIRTFTKLIPRVQVYSSYQSVLLSSCYFMSLYWLAMTSMEKYCSACTNYQSPIFCISVRSIACYTGYEADTNVLYKLIQDQFSFCQ